MKTHRLRAPSADGALLAIPPLAEAGEQLRSNVQRLEHWNHDFQGRNAERLKAIVRRDILSQARDFLHRHGLSQPPASREDVPTPIVMTGHQPELFHPGVWIKNFATSAIAQAHKGLGLNLIVDNDLPKSSSIRVPDTSGRTARSVRVEFDRAAGEVPYEEAVVHDESLFTSFADRVRDVLQGSIPDPLLNEYWPIALRRSRETRRLGLRFTMARREIEAAWGHHNLEIPLSEVCKTEGFFWFTSHILANLARFQQIHNDALVQYREAYGIRSRHHPVPALVTRGEWREAPFWVWRESEPRRQPLLVRQDRATMQLRISGEDAPLIELPLSPDREACCAVERLHELDAMKVRLRTRALTTTMFCRYLLSDLFIHGIGGAKYDELGDSIAGRFYQVEPPPFMTLSLTAWLGLPRAKATPAMHEGIRQKIREVIYNPDRFLHEPLTDEVRSLIQERRDVIAREAGTKAERAARFKRIRQLNKALSEPLLAELKSLQDQDEQTLKGLAWNRVVQSRDFSLVLHSARRLHSLSQLQI